MAMKKQERSEVSTLRVELKEGMEELKRHMGVIAEGLRSEIKIVAEQYGSVVRKLEEHDARFDKIDLRFERLEIEFKGMKMALFDTSHRVSDHEMRIRKLEIAK